MDDENLFDFDLDDEIDSNLEKDDTDEKPVSHTPKPKKAVAKKSAPPQKSGKTSGKASGSVSRKPKRVPMHIRQPLTVDSRDPNFEYRIVNDTPGRVERLQAAGWIIDDKSTVGDTYAGKASQLGSASTVPVGRGTNAVVMKIPKTLYNEDQAAKQKIVDETEESMLSEAGESINRAAGGKDEWRGEIRIDRAAIE